MSKRLTSILVSIAGVLAVGAIVWFFVLPMFRPHVFHGQIIQSNQAAPSVELDGPDGSTVRLSDYKGKVVVLYFGYTFCPDVCPTTLAKLNQALGIMGDKAEDVQVIMVSVDPKRDTPEVLKEYMAHFNPNFIGVTGDPETIDRVATMYGVYYEAKAGSVATGYLVDHTATLMIVDRDGYLKLVLPFKGTAEEVADDLLYFVG